MATAYSAVVQQDGDWWIGWIEEVPGVNSQGRTREELLDNLRDALAEALEMNRADARSAATGSYIPPRSVAGRGGAARSIPAEWTYFDERDQPPYFHSRNAVTSPAVTGLFWMYFTMRSSCSSLRDQ